MAGFSLHENAFAVLGVTPRATIAEIDIAAEDAIIECPDKESQLLRLKQELLTPNKRLLAELSWLPDLPPTKALRLLGSVDQTPAGSELFVSLPPLSAANVAAHRLDREGSRELLEMLLEAHAKLTPKGVLACLEGLRKASGFPPIAFDQLGAALRSLRKIHAGIAVGALVRGSTPSADLSALLEGVDDSQKPLLAEILTEYDHWSTPFLFELEKKIELSINDVIGGADPTELCDLLREWDDLCQPAQLYAQLSGLDEERTGRIYRKVRSCCIELANNLGRVFAAQRIASVMRQLFRELPSASAQLDIDLDALANLAHETELDEYLQPLLIALENARANMGSVLVGLRTFGLVDGAGPAVAKLRQSIVEVCHSTQNARTSDAALALVRSFALDLNNEHNDPGAALGLLTGALTIKRPSEPALIRRFDADIATARSNAAFAKLRPALDQQRWGDAAKLVDALLADRPDEDARRDLLAIKGRIADARNRQYSNWVGWAFWGLVGLGVVVSTQCNRSDRASPYQPYEPPTQEQEYAPAADAPYYPPSAEPSAELAAPEVAAPIVEEPAVETPPEPGASLLLSRGQIRYCAFQNVRLDELGKFVDQSLPQAVEAFNRKVDDFNARCGSARAETTILEQENAAAEEARPRLAEAARVEAGGLGNDE